MKMYKIALAMALAWATASYSQVPWTTLQDTSATRVITVVGSSHMGMRLPAHQMQALSTLLRDSDVVFFEAVDGIFADRRLKAYEQHQQQFVQARELGGYARLCAVAAKLTLPQSAHATVEAAPAIFRALVIARKSGDPVDRRTIEGEDDLNLSDFSLQRFAKRHARPVLEAETTEDWIELASRFPREQVDEAISSICKATQDPATRQRTNDIVKRLPELHMKGDWDAYWQLYENHEIGVVRMPRPLFDQVSAARNRRMVARIFSHPGNRVVLVAGAAHLGGPQGVVRLLIEHGYKPVHTGVDSAR